MVSPARTTMPPSTSGFHTNVRDRSAAEQLRQSVGHGLSMHMIVQGLCATSDLCVHPVQTARPRGRGTRRAISRTSRWRRLSSTTSKKFTRADGGARRLIERLADDLLLLHEGDPGRLQEQH